MGDVTSLSGAWENGMWGGRTNSSMIQGLITRSNNFAFYPSNKKIQSRILSKQKRAHQL